MRIYPQNLKNHKNPFQMCIPMVNLNKMMIFLKIKKVEIMNMIDFLYDNNLSELWVSLLELILMRRIKDPYC